MIGQKRQDFQVLAGRLGDAGRGKGMGGRGGGESHQPCEISGGVAIGRFPSQEIRNTTKLRAELVLSRE